MSPSKKSSYASLPVESSWRMVEGSENDSFDTSIVQDPYEDDLIVSSGPSQGAVSSQDYSIGSQDSIRDFATNADEEQVILRSPFHPSLASTRHTSVDKEQTPVPEFFMPKIEVESPRRSNRSSRTIRPTMDEPQAVRRRVYQRGASDGSPGKEQYNARAKFRRYDSDDSQFRQPSSWERFSSAVPQVLFETAAWCLSVIGMALRYAKWPLAIMLAMYMTMGAGMVARNMITNSITTSLSPICRIPGAALLDLPFCPDSPTAIGQNGTGPVEFDELMNIQAEFEKVLESSASGVSLPMEMKRSEAAVRDLRTIIKYEKDLPAREELLYEFDGYISSMRDISSDLLSFNTHVGSAVDSVISINHWTSRYIDSISAARAARENTLSRWTDWVFSPFQPTVFDERMLLDKYVEHTALVSDKIANLIIEAQAVLRLLTQAENHLELINEHVVRSGNEVKEKKSEVFWTLWTLVGANNRRLHNLKAQLGLLRLVESQRTSAVAQLLGLVHDLGDIQTKLSDLRDRVAAPELLSDQASIPLSVHIETINAGVERLESARSRIRAEENDRIQQALARARGEENLIEG
ncbi:putative SUN domain-containing protein [Seiridium cardinale]|uniref:SUN domain-containing protein n=1 Tax=Seiridium cardinale TaxID=138064 RepID=A0ABR2XNW8_9PEZI